MPQADQARAGGRARDQNAGGKSAAEHHARDDAIDGGLTNMGKRGARRVEPAAASGEARPAEEALAILKLLGEQRVEVSHGRHILAAAYLMACPSTAYALRLLAAVDQCHAEQGVDLHHGARARTR